MVLASIRHEQGAIDLPPETVLDDVSRRTKELRFRVSFTPVVPMHSGELAVIASDGSEYVFQLDHIVRQPEGSFLGEAPGDLLSYEITELKNLDPRDRAKARVRDLTYALYGPVAAILSFTGLVGMAAIAILPSRSRKSQMLAVLFVLFYVVVSRVGLFTLLDATSWVADRIRYLYPAIPVYMALVVSFTFAGVRSVVSAARQQQTRRMGESDLEQPTDA
jgi:hypothetical protein